MAKLVIDRDHIDCWNKNIYYLILFKKYVIPLLCWMYLSVENNLFLKVSYSQAQGEEVIISV